jgi:hypothetical protein
MFLCSDKAGKAKKAKGAAKPKAKAKANAIEEDPVMLKARDELLAKLNRGGDL